MSDPTSAGSGQSTDTTPSQPPNKSKLAIIIVASIGGFIFVVALVLLVVPYARRRAARRQVKNLEGSTVSDRASATSQSRRQAHDRALSVDASVPLLEPEPSIHPEYSRFGNLAVAQPDTAIQSNALHNNTGDSIQSPRRFAPSSVSFNPRRSPSPEFEPGPSRSFRAAPQPSLRHARTRIAHMPMDPLPEDSATDGSPQRGPSPA
ncbi:hypothetical protein BC834DRAFT_901979, partial [Gloeopeniophorella convolvens]